ncbi:MAG TPA: hypothetical protein H9671_03205, partial [Firmicutes bacterium]|nr:hypothetical protein [Bacillota bacterium]
VLPAALPINRKRKPPHAVLPAAPPSSKAFYLQKLFPVGSLNREQFKSSSVSRYYIKRGQTK